MRSRNGSRRASSKQQSISSKASRKCRRRSPECSPARTGGNSWCGWAKGTAIIAASRACRRDAGAPPTGTTGLRPARNHALALRQRLQHKIRTLFHARLRNQHRLISEALIRGHLCFVVRDGIFEAVSSLRIVAEYLRPWRRDEHATVVAE